MRVYALALSFLLGLFILFPAAHAQGVQRLCIPSYNADGALSCQDVTSANPLPVNATVLGYPTGAAPILGNGTGTTGAVVGTLAAAATKTTYICGFSVSAIGGAATVGPIVIAGPATSLTYQFASTATGATLAQTFQPCIPASAVNTAITTTTTADGSASAVDVNSWGYQL